MTVTKIYEYALTDNNDARNTLIWNALPKRTKSLINNAVVPYTEKMFPRCYRHKFYEMQVDAMVKQTAFYEFGIIY